MPELWLNPLVGQPPALWYSAVAQMTTSTTMARVPTVVLIQKRRLRSICAIACWRAGCPVAGASAPLSPGLSWSALAAGATVVISGLTARELGGGRRPQLLAAVGTGTMPALLAIGHLAGPTAYDVLAWAALAWVVIRIGRTGDCRWWLAAGLIAMTRALNQDNGGLGNAGTWVIGQLIIVTLALVWVWPAGLRFLWRSGRPLWRALAWAYGLLFVLFALTTGAQIYYLAGAYPYLLAAGFVAIDRWLAARPGRVRNLLLATALTTAAALPLALPVLPAADAGWTYKVVHNIGETMGRPHLPVHRPHLPLGPAVAAAAPL